MPFTAQPSLQSHVFRTQEECNTIEPQLLFVLKDRDTDASCSKGTEIDPLFQFLDVNKGEALFFTAQTKVLNGPNSIVGKKETL